MSCPRGADGVCVTQAVCSSVCYVGKTDMSQKVSSGPGPLESVLGD